MDFILTQQTVRNIISVVMGLLMNTHVPLEHYGTMTWRIVTGLQMFTVQKVLDPHLHHPHNNLCQQLLLRQVNSFKEMQILTYYFQCIVCTDPNGLYSHPTDCQKYYQCGHGTPYEYTCPTGTLWNDNIKNCDWAANVHCTKLL